MRSNTSLYPFSTVVVALLCALFASALGCSRTQYRLQADREVDGLIAEKSNDSRWAAPYFSVEMDPRSRYYDPYDPDRPPMPPDDPAAHAYMHWVDGKKGWPNWHRDGDRFELENPCWREYLPQYVEMTENGEINLSVDSALQLAYIHAPNFQQQLEELYLSALDVSTERFRFDTQFFGGVDTDYAHEGRDRSIAGERNTLTEGQNLLLRRRFATAGELLVGFANSFVWQFAGADTHVEGSILNFNLVQPLLRAAGRDVAMEQLTIVERALLNNLRAFQRYRQGFYTQVAIGQLGVSGPSRRGGFFGGTGLTGFTGTGAGGLGGVGEATGFGRGGFGGGGGGTAASGYAGGGAGTVGGLIGLVQQLQQIRNTRDSLDLQLRTLSLLEAHLEAGVIDLTQVDQFRQSIETERATLLQAENNLEEALESYKTGTLGLPPDVAIKLDDDLIRQFQFIDPKLTDVQSKVSAFQDKLGQLPDEPQLTELEQALDQADELPGLVSEQVDAVAFDLERLDERSVRRFESMTDAERRVFSRDRSALTDALNDLKQRLQKSQSDLEQLAGGLQPATRRQTTDGAVVWLSSLLRLVQELSLVQARARLESIDLDPIELESEDAFYIALANRLDLMNNRAALVDTWRLIAFNADALQSDLSVTFNGDIRTTGNNVAKFQAPTGTLQAGLQFDAPFTRLLERNNYRSVLIDYQRDRRRFIQTLDGVHQTMRQALRQLEEHRINLEIQRRAVAIAIRRVDNTQEEFSRPVPPPAPGQPAAQFGPTAALNLLTALSDLRNTQNNFMSVWLNYYATRMVLMRELGIMQLDEQGRWIDVPISELEFEPLDGLSPPPAVPLEWLDQAFRGEGPEPDRREGVQLQPVSAQTFQVTDEAVPAEGEPNVPDDEPEETPATEEAKTADESVGDQILRFLGRR